MRGQRVGTAIVWMMTSSEMPLTRWLSSPPYRSARIARQNASIRYVVTSSAVERASTFWRLRVTSQPTSGGMVPTMRHASIQTRGVDGDATSAM